MMGDNSIPASLNGVPMNDEEFERHLQEIIGDAPDLNDCSNTVQSGSSQKALSQSAEHGQSQSSRSPSLPPTASLEPTIHSRSLPFNGDFVPKPTMTQTAQNKLGQVKAWGLNTYKCTKQLLSEKLGKVSRTVDLELESQIEVLRDTKRKYEHILCLSKTLSNHFSQVVITQRALGEAFSELAQRSPELQDEFTYNCETQKALVRNGETLLGAMNFFISSVNTLIAKTMEDTLVTVKSYETARLQYDAYRADLEQTSMEPKDSSHETKIAEAKKMFEEQKETYDQLRADLTIKLKFLDENRIKVMHKQLLLFHNAVSAYFSGNQSALEATLRQFNIKLKAPNLGSPSWLEQH